jgi:hypothetical protein
VDELALPGLPLGVAADARYLEAEATLGPPDGLLL